MMKVYGRKSLSLDKVSYMWPISPLPTYICIGNYSEILKFPMLRLFIIKNLCIIHTCQCIVKDNLDSSPSIYC